MRSTIHVTTGANARAKTRVQRTDLVRDWLAAFGVAGKHVLEIGCGSGDVSIAAARLGARVTGLDIVPELVTSARDAAAAAGLSATTTFRVANVVDEPLESADVVLMVGVIAFYRDLDQLIPRACALAKERLIVVDARGAWWRRQLRSSLARVRGSQRHYHSSARLSQMMSASGFEETHRVAGDSYTALAYKRR